MSPEASSWLFAPRTKRVAPAPPFQTPPSSFLPVLQIIVGKCGLQASDYVDSVDKCMPAHLSARPRLLRTRYFVTRHVQGCILARCGGDCTLLLLSDDKVRHPPCVCVVDFSHAYPWLASTSLCYARPQVDIAAAVAHVAAQLKI